jgi:hypothetical protein
VDVVRTFVPTLSENVNGNVVPILGISVAGGIHIVSGEVSVALTSTADIRNKAHLKVEAVPVGPRYIGIVPLTCRIECDPEESPVLIFAGMFTAVKFGVLVVSKITKALASPPDMEGRD